MSEIKIIEALPPNIKDIEAALGPVPKSAIFAFGSVLFNPSGREISEFLRIHELTHMSHQKNVEKWWDQYLSDPDFRFVQELEAFSNEYNCFRTHQKDRNKRIVYLQSCAERLSAPHYGNLLSCSEAFKLIKEHADQRFHG